MSRLSKAWVFTLIYTWFVVLWGAFVRASGSGDGCGKNWPKCHGQLIPKNATIETLIEYIHRFSSGLYGLLILGLVFWTIQHFRQQKKGLLWLLPLAVLILTVFEALIGAKLVLSGLVGSNESWARALIMVVHLINTFLLMASLIGTLYFTMLSATESSPILKRPLETPNFNLNIKLSFALITLGLFLVASFGAITALGDTLYPSETLTKGISEDFSMASPWILKLRVFHPLLAVLTCLYLFLTFYDFRNDKVIKFYLITAIFTLCLGVVNLLLLAPIYMQLIHLLTAQILWSSHCYLGFKIWNKT